MAITFGSLRATVRLRCDSPIGGPLSESELSDMLNSSLSELYDLLVVTFEDYYLTGPVAVTLASGASISLPADFYKLRGLDRQDSNSDWLPVDPFNFRERGEFARAALALPPSSLAFRYRLTPTTIEVYPQASNGGAYQYWYVPVRADITDDSTQVTFLQHWEEYAILDACIKACAKEESDPSVFAAQKQAVRARILAAAPSRDASGPATIVDVRHYRGSRGGGGRFDLW